MPKNTGELEPVAERHGANTAAAEIPADNARGIPVPDDQDRPVGLIFFAQTNAWRLDRNGDREPAVELMGGFVYQMQRQGHLADTEANFRILFEKFIQS